MVVLLQELVFALRGFVGELFGVVLQFLPPLFLRHVAHPLCLHPLFLLAAIKMFRKLSTRGQLRAFSKIFKLLTKSLFFCLLWDTFSLSCFYSNVKAPWLASGPWRSICVLWHVFCLFKNRPIKLKVDCRVYYACCVMDPLVNRHKTHRHRSQMLA